MLPLSWHASDTLTSGLKPAGVSSTAAAAAVVVVVVVEMALEPTAWNISISISKFTPRSREGRSRMTIGPRTPTMPDQIAEAKGRRRGSGKAKRVART